MESQENPRYWCEQKEDFTNNDNTLKLGGLQSVGKWEKIYALGLPKNILKITKKYIDKVKIFPSENNSSQ